MTCRMDVAVYRVLEEYRLKEAHTLSAEAARYLERQLTRRRKLGLHLPEHTRAQVEALTKEESSLCVRFSKNINEENTLLEFFPQELGFSHFFSVLLIYSLENSRV